MNFTWPMTRKSETIPRTCCFCSTLPICFLSHASLKKLWDLFTTANIAVDAGTIERTFMQLLLWPGGMIISFNPPETQFSIITRYAPCIPPIQSLRLYLCNQTLFILCISATQTHPTSRSTCASIIYPSPSFLWLHIFDKFPSKPSVLYTHRMTSLLPWPRRILWYIYLANRMYLCASLHTPKQTLLLCWEDPAFGDVRAV